MLMACCAGCPPDEGEATANDPATSDPSSGPGGPSSGDIDDPTGETGEGPTSTSQDTAPDSTTTATATTATDTTTTGEPGDGTSGDTTTDDATGGTTTGGATPPGCMQREFTAGTLTMLDFTVKDAEYSKQLDRIVAVSHDPPALHLYDPWTGEAEGVELPLAATSVSVGPGGLFAAVGHDGWVSYVDLVTRAVVATHPVTADVLDVVLADNGYIYAFPRQDQWEQIYTIEIATGTQTQSGDWAIYAGTVAKLHPDGDALYGANNGLSPSDIEKYDIQGGTA
ncbi:MAG TPA: hypothetical protein VGB85_09355, partial [Nannocystis sp.]